MTRRRCHNRFPERVYRRRYVGRGGRRGIQGRLCRIVHTWRRSGPHNVAVEFADGTPCVVPMRCLRTVTDPDAAGLLPTAGQNRAERLRAEAATLAVLDRKAAHAVAERRRVREMLTAR